MSEVVNLVLSVKEMESEIFWKKRSAQMAGLEYSENLHFKILRKAIDARKSNIKVNLRVEVSSEPIHQKEHIYQFNPLPKDSPEVCIVGLGPAGLFAGLKLLSLGIRPVIIERGKDVRARRRDLVKIHREHIVDENSNYCFGEGGAGTYSDGKLYTRSKKRGVIREVLELLVDFGAQDSILFENHPHIGTNKLPKIISSMRQCIEQHGGEVHFETKLENLKIEEGKVSEVSTNQWTREFENVILATGHSARDIFEMLHNLELSLENKAFAVGVRVEHSQDFIDKKQYHGQLRSEVLPAAAYSLTAQVDNKGVYSFCMCPGGIIAPCATNSNEVVTNGWSPSKRNNPHANSGIVVTIDGSEIDGFSQFGAFAGLEYQKAIEKLCWELAGKTQKAPAQRVSDFMNNRLSKTLPDCSYQPGITSVNLREKLPKEIADPIAKAFKEFDKKIRGWISSEAVIVAPESRTSSPIRIPRDESFQHPNARGLYPCGEGAGYAGGIVSAAIDGINVASAISNKLS